MTADHDGERMAELDSMASAWNLRADALLESRDADMISVLDAIADGIRLRRRLDEAAGYKFNSHRQQLVQQVCRLERIAVQATAGIEEFTDRHRRLSEHVRTRLGEDEHYLHNVVLRPEISDGVQALLLESLRFDLHWTATLLAALEGDALPDNALAARLRIAAVSHSIANLYDEKCESECRQLRQRCDAIRMQLFEHRVSQEIARPIESADAEELWKRRFALSQLYAKVSLLAESMDVDVASAGPKQWMESLDDCSRKLADAAESRLAAMSDDERRGAWNRLSLLARGNANEIVTLLEDVPLAQAVCLLQVSYQDYDRLVQSGISMIGVSPTNSTTKELRGEIRSVRRLANRARYRHQEKRLRLTMESLFGRRFVKYLEQLILVLIIVITGLLVAEWALEWRKESRLHDVAGLSATVSAELDAIPLEAGLIQLAENAGATLVVDAQALRRTGTPTDVTLSASVDGDTLDHALDRLIYPHGLTHVVHDGKVIVTDATGAEELSSKAADLLTESQRRFFAYADLYICLVFLTEFFLKLVLVPPIICSAGSLGARFPLLHGKWVYFRRHLIVDFMASIPFGYIFHRLPTIDHALLESAPIVRLVRFARLPRLARIGRLLIFALRATDQMVYRYASVFNRKIVLFEPDPDLEMHEHSRGRLIALREAVGRQQSQGRATLTGDQQVQLAGALLADLEIRLASLPTGHAALPSDESLGMREIAAESVVQKLTEMTPEQIVEEMGPAFAESVRRYLRLFDVPLIRRLPVVRELLPQCEKGAAEVAALAANHVGHLMQALLNIAYYIADLHGTISGPIFLDRLGSSLVKATERPAKRLILLGLIVLVASLVFSIVPVPNFIEVSAEKIKSLLAWPVIVLGAICVAPLLLGIWLRRIANQAADFSERVVEAQFAAQTKQAKVDHVRQDARFLDRRVIAPELELRNSDDQLPPDAKLVQGESQAHPHSAAHATGKAEELIFLRNVDLLYQDYLDGSLFHRSDTKTTTQLLGNLALTNLRQSCLVHSLADRKRLSALDLNRSADALFGGPYMWFSYITRMITQQTARLLVDYNRNAIPTRRLACSSKQVRDRYRQWLASRAGIEPEEVLLPDSISPFGNQDCPTPSNRSHQAHDLLETVDFTAVDFLTANKRRDAELRRKYGDQVARLVIRDRQTNVRTAFRSYPLHQIPSAQRTINVFTLYESYLAGGRILLVPFYLMWWTFRLLRFAVGRVVRVVWDILHPQVRHVDNEEADTYAVARRKIHRMRKPVFMACLWMRARFDIEYVGLQLPEVPMENGGESFLEKDLDFIGATRRERMTAERLLQDHQERLYWITRWLDEYELSFRRLPMYLQSNFPYLADQSAEVVRALVTAFVVDHDDIFTLCCSLTALKQIMNHAADPANSQGDLPERLPPAVDRHRPFWYRPVSNWRQRDGLFSRACFARYDAAARNSISKSLRRHKPLTRNWIDVVLSQGGDDPDETVRERIRAVIRRSNLWSDQILALRTIQTLTMLDVYHYCEMVWQLGGYEQLGQTEFTDTLPVPESDTVESRSDE